VVLARTGRGDSDWLITFLTRERGLIQAVAKNARQSVRRFGGGLLTPGMPAWFYIRHKPNLPVGFVDRGEFNSKVPAIPADPVAQTLAAWSVELVKVFEARDNPAHASFNLLLRYLSALYSIGNYAPPALGPRELSLSFTKRYLELAGFGATLNGCRLCGRFKAAAWFLEPGLKGLICADCGRAAGRRFEPVPTILIEALSALGRRCELPGFPEVFLAQAEFFFHKLASLEAGRSFNSHRILQQLLNDAPQPPKELRGPKNRPALVPPSDPETVSYRDTAPLLARRIFEDAAAAEAGSFEPDIFFQPDGAAEPAIFSEPGDFSESGTSPDLDFPAGLAQTPSSDPMPDPAHALAHFKE
jgi:DNA repair protein RecO (recombination protein O)